MSTHTNKMLTSIKLTGAQRRNLQEVLNSFYFQQITPNNEQKLRCKFVKTLSDSQRRSNNGLEAAEGLSFPLARDTWGSRSLRLNKAQFKGIEMLFTPTEHNELRFGINTSLEFLELNWPKIHTVEKVYSLIDNAIRQANRLMHARIRCDERDRDFLIYIIKYYRLSAMALTFYADSGKWVNGKTLYDYNRARGSSIISNQHLYRLTQCSKRVFVNVEEIKIPTEQRYVHAN